LCPSVYLCTALIESLVIATAPQYPLSRFRSARLGDDQDQYVDALLVVEHEIGQHPGGAEGQRPDGTVGVVRDMVVLTRTD
jgi:hypothetical protein